MQIQPPPPLIDYVFVGEKLPAAALLFVARWACLYCKNWFPISGKSSLFYALTRVWVCVCLKETRKQTTLPLLSNMSMAVDWVSANVERSFLFTSRQNQKERKAIKTIVTSICLRAVRGRTRNGLSPMATLRVRSISLIHSSAPRAAALRGKRLFINHFLKLAV